VAPVILPPDRFAAWLDPAADAEGLGALLRPYRAEDMEGFPVGTWVNSPRNEGPRCVEPVA
jgi:putative SOS response-associated peptidase YedK